MSAHEFHFRIVRETKWSHKAKSTEKNPIQIPSITIVGECSHRCHTNTIFKKTAFNIQQYVQTRNNRKTASRNTTTLSQTSMQTTTNFETFPIPFEKNYQCHP